MNDIHVRIKGAASGRVRVGATVAEALALLGPDVARHALAARVDGHEVDLVFRLEAPGANGDHAVEIEPLLPDTLEGLDVIRHSTAHLLAAAVLDLFPGTKLGIGPALRDDPRFGFFYDVIAPRPLADADLPAIEERMRDLAGRSLAYRREEVPKPEALRIFEEREEPLKCELIRDRGGEQVSVYRIDGSPFVDFCLGPHVPDTDRLGAFKLLSLAGAYWKGDASRPQMQRIYGTAFATRAELEPRDATTAVWGASSISSRFTRSTARDWSSGTPKVASCAKRWRTTSASSCSSVATAWSTRRTSPGATSGGSAGTRRTSPTRCSRRWRATTPSSASSR